MERAGIISGDSLNAAAAFPLLIDNHDGAGPKLCAIHNIEGSVLRCGSTIVTGAALKIGNPGKNDVLQSMARLTGLIKKESSGNWHLVFSCYGRSITMVDLKDEMEAFQKQMEGLSYIYISSGGEFGPVYDRGGGILNRFHQYSIISASF
jgi:small ligand-binding sensory domain FIST